MTERALLGATPLRVIHSRLRRIDVDQAPLDRPVQHLPQRLGGLEAMPGRDRHPPRRDLRRAQLAETALAKHPHRLRQQPTKLVDRLRLPAMLAEIDIDELRERRRLNETPFAAQPIQRPLKRLNRRLLSREPTTLNPPRTTTTNPVAIRPPCVASTRGSQWKYLSLLHQGSLLSSRPPQPRPLPPAAGTDLGA